MEFAMREWLTIIIGVAILAVVLDGVRRMRQSRRNTIRSAKQYGDVSDRHEGETFPSELPAGGARVVTQRDQSEAQQFNVDVKKAYAASRTTKGFRIPEQVTLNLDETVPMLMESVAEPKNPRKQIPLEPTLGSIDEIVEFDDDRDPTNFESLDESDYSDEDYEPEAEEQVEDDVDLDASPTLQGAVELEPEPEPEPISKAHSRRQLEPQQFDFGEGRTEKEEQDWEEEPWPASAAEDDEDKQNYFEPEEVFVINIMAPKGYYFAGSDLLDVSLEAGLRFGEMNIFHRHHHIDGSGPILFSMANIVMPGTFDLKTMEDFKTPGISLFLTLPCSAKSMDAFELLYATADYLADNLGGDLKDEQRNGLTAQTVEHYRQRIRDYERQRLMQH